MWIRKKTLHSIHKIWKNESVKMEITRSVQFQWKNYTPRSKSIAHNYTVAAHTYTVWARLPSFITCVSIWRTSVYCCCGRRRQWRKICISTIAIISIELCVNESKHWLSQKTLNELDVRSMNGTLTRHTKCHHKNWLYVCRRRLNQKWNKLIACQTEHTIMQFMLSIVSICRKAKVFHTPVCNGNRFWLRSIDQHLSKQK